jgi:hypothetical protein
MKIKILTLECAMCVLGPECAICHQLEKTTKEVVKALGIDASIEEVKDPMAIAQYPARVCCVPGIPFLVVNDELVSSGRMPPKEEITQFIINALDKEERSRKLEN